MCPELLVAYTGVSTLRNKFDCALHNVKKIIITPLDSSFVLIYSFPADGKLDGDLGVGTGVRGEVLTVRQDMIVVVLKGAGRKQLAYIPSQCHMNDLMLDLKRYRIGETSKMVVQA